MDRREFLTAAAATAASAFLSSSNAGPQDTGGAPLGIQFFTFIGPGIGITWEQYSGYMETVRKIGYEGIELAGIQGWKPKQIKDKADELGLQIPSLHIGFDQVFPFLPPRPWGPDITFAQAQDAVYTPVGVVQLARALSGPARDLGCRFATVAGGGEINFSDVDHIMKFADGLNKANTLVKQKGLMLSFHPHAPEWTKMKDGRTPMDIIIANTDKDILYECDVYWAQKGGGDGDAVATVEKYASHFGLYHLKDVAKGTGDIETPGQGVLDFGAIKAEATKFNNPWFFVERDGAKAPTATAQQSYDALHKLGYGLRA